MDKFLSSQFSGYLAIAAIVLLIGAVWFIRHSGYVACKQDQIVEKTQIMEKRNAIANKRPSALAVTERLRDGTF